MFARTAVFCAVMAPAAAFMTSPLPAASARLGLQRPMSVRQRPMSVRVHATAAAMPSVPTPTLADYGDVANVQLSTLQGMALIDKDFPNKKQVLQESMSLKYEPASELL